MFTDLCVFKSMLNAGVKCTATSIYFTQERYFYSLQITCGHFDLRSQVERRVHLLMNLETHNFYFHFILCVDLINVSSSSAALFLICYY